MRSRSSSARLPRRLVQGREALAALEFALVLPVMITALLATTDVALATITGRRLEAAVQSVAEIASAQAAQLNNRNTLTSAQVAIATNAVFGIFPPWKTAIGTGLFAMTLTGVVFTAQPYGCQSNCTYTAQVAWSAANQYGKSEIRPCGPLTMAANTAAVSASTLPAGAFGATSLMVADIDYTYHPVFFNFVMGNVRMQRSAYVPPRIGNGTTFVALPGSTATVCSANANQ